MIKFLMLDRQEFKRVLSGKFAIYESLMWLFCSTLFFVGFGTGSIWIDLTVPALVGLVFAGICSSSLARETWRYEWVDKSGVSISNHPNLMNRYLVMIYRCSVLYIPIAFFSYGGHIEFLWYLKLAYVFFAMVWTGVIITFGAKILWRIRIHKAAMYHTASILAMFIPFAILCIEGYWSKKAINYLQSDLLLRIEKNSGYLFMILGVASVLYNLWRLLIFFRKGGVGYEKHRRCKLLANPMKLGQSVVVILCALPFSVFGAFNRHEQNMIAQALVQQDVSAAVNRLNSYSARLSPGMPYGADYENVKGLVELYKQMDTDSPHLVHMLNLARYWWMQRDVGKVKGLTPHLVNEKLLNNHQKLIVLQLKLDKDGQFTAFMVSSGFVSREFANSLKL